MKSLLSWCHSVVPLAISLLLTSPMLLSAQTAISPATTPPATATSPDDPGKTKTLVATVFGEALYLEQMTPADAEIKRKELPPGDYENWLRGYRVARTYDNIWGAVSKNYIEREKLDVSQEEFNAIVTSVERRMKFEPEQSAETTLTLTERKGISVAWARASLSDWKLCKSLYEKYGGRVGIGSLGSWIALDGQNALLKEHLKAGDITFHHAEIENAFWKYAQRDRFADAYPTGDRLKQLLASPPHLREDASARKEHNMRERIGSALGADIYRDQLKNDPPTYTEVVQLFMAPAVEEFRDKHREHVEMTDDEIRQAARWQETELKREGGEQWEFWQKRQSERLAELPILIKQIESELAKPTLTNVEKKNCQTALRLAKLEQTVPNAGLVAFMFGGRKFEQYLFDNYGGGRIIHQQLGPEALDARRKLLLELEAAGKFQITDPALRKLAFDYWERPSHPGGFHTDRRLLDFPWTKTHQEKIRGNEGVVPDPHSPLGELMQQQKARDESLRRISYQGTVRQYAGLNVQRENTESIDQFISRVASLAPEYDQVPPYSLSGCRDFASGVYQFTIGDINADIPKYMSWFIGNKEYIQLMGRKPGVCEAIITNKRNDIQDDREASMVRLDIAAFRPVKDKPMSDVLEKTLSEPITPEAGGRPAWRLEKLNNRVGWMATFKSFHAIETPPGAKQVLWNRIYWEQIEGELVIVRVDQLSVVEEEDTTPLGVILLDDHRLVDEKPVPFRVRHFRLGKVVKGVELIIADVKLNDSVDMPKQMMIPEGTPVRDFISGKQYRQPPDETTITR